MGGGGKGGGGQQINAPPPVYIDPVTGRSFTDDPAQGFGLNYGEIDPNYHPMSGAQKLNDFISQREATAKTKSDADAATAAADKQATRDKFTTGLAGAKTNATNSISNYFKEHGVDPSGYSDRIASAVNTAAGNVADLSPTPGGAFTPSMGSDLFNEIQGGNQSQALQGYNKLFSPSYSSTSLSDSLVDPAVNGVLSAQFDPLEQQLQNAVKRGQLSSVGYTGAEKALGDKRTAAQASVSKIAQNVLGSDRSDVDQYIGTGRTAAGSVPLGTSFDANPYVAGAKSRVDRDAASFGGDVRSAVGDTSYASLSDLMNAGGQYQGAQAASGAPGMPTGVDPADIAAAANKLRGLGTQGAF